jgi:hypothetical protein
MDPIKKEESGEAAVDTIESIAESMGWNPDFEGAEGKEKLSAADYIRKGKDIQKDMRNSLKNQKRTMEEMKTAITNIQSHNEKVNKAEINKLRAQLKEQKKEAIIDGDVEAVEKIDSEMKDLKEQEKENKAEAKDANKAFKAWNKKNEWYGSDEDMTDAVDIKVKRWMRRNPDHEESDIYEQAEKIARKDFPEYFGDTKKKEPRTVVNEAGGRTSSGGKKVFTEADLNGAQKSAMNSFVRMDIMSKEQYIADLVTAGDLK